MTDWGKRLKKYQTLTLDRINRENLAHLTAYQEMVEATYSTRPTVEEVVEAIFDKYANREHKIELEFPEFGKLALKKVNVEHVKLLEAACESTEKATGRKPELTLAADEYFAKFFARDTEYSEYVAKKAEKEANRKSAKSDPAKPTPPKAELPKSQPAATLTPKAEPAPAFGTSGVGSGGVNS